MRYEQLEMVRVYLTESEHRAQALLDMLLASGIRGATLLRGISGFGKSGVMHRADWLDLAGDLPLVLEFSDTKERIDAVLTKLLNMTEPGHVLRWPVQGLYPDS